MSDRDRFWEEALKDLAVDDLLSAPLPPPTGTCRWQGCPVRSSVSCVICGLPLCQGHAQPHPTQPDTHSCLTHWLRSGHGTPPPSREEVE
jgi:hypothetical protein